MDPENQPRTQQPITSQPDQLSPQLESHSSFLRILLIVLSVGIVLSLIGGAYLLGTKQQGKTTIVSNEKMVNVSPTQNLTINPTNSPSLTASPTANWKTYKSNTLGLTFLYPQQLPIQESGGRLSINNGVMLAYILTGQDKYFGCAAPQNVCPKGTSLVINSQQVFKNIGTATSTGGVNLLEYEFIGTNPNNPVVSSNNTYSLYFEYHGDPNSSNMISIFNSIASTIRFAYSRPPGPAGN